jgi:hypothetical protein
MIKKSTYIASLSSINEYIILKRHDIKVFTILFRIFFHASLERLGVYDLAHIFNNEYVGLDFNVCLEAPTLKICLEWLYVGVVFCFKISIRTIETTWATLATLDHDHAIKTIVTACHQTHLTLLLTRATIACHYHFFAFHGFTLQNFNLKTNKIILLFLLFFLKLKGSWLRICLKSKQKRTLTDLIPFHNRYLAFRSLQAP